MKKSKLLSLLTAFLFTFAFASALIIYADCPEGHFKDIQGPKNVKLGERHTYSVVIDGTFRSVKWSITGGQFVKEYSEGKRYYCEVIWDEPNSDEYRVKVYGHDGCGNEKAKRYYINMDRGNTHQPVSGRIKRIDIPDARTIADSLKRYYESRANDRAFDEGIVSQLVRSLTNKMNNDEVVDILWGQGLKPAMAASMEQIVQSCIGMKDREMLYRTLKREARAFLKIFYAGKNIDENVLDKWADILAKSRNPKVTQVVELQQKLVNSASDLTVTHLKNAGIVPRLIITSRN